MTQARILKSMVGAIVLASCAPLMAQATDPVGTLPLDELLGGG